MVRATLRRSDGAVVASAISAVMTLPSGAHQDVSQELEVKAPRLWSPTAPTLHRLDCEILAGERVVDAETLRVGIRRIAIAADGFSINGETMYLRGTNRHQEYPYIGYALSDAAQYRNARTIKEAGFDYVRLSHYPHAPAFMDACDELGLVVMDCIPGWQYFTRSPPSPSCSIATAATSSAGTATIRASSCGKYRSTSRRCRRSSWPGPTPSRTRNIPATSASRPGGCAVTTYSSTRASTAAAGTERTSRA